MVQNSTLGSTLQRLRESAGISQTELAGRLPFTASRISRLESGDSVLDRGEASTIARAIGTPEAGDYAEYLARVWTILERPSFDHPCVQTLWAAEEALERLNQLADDPDLKNAFLKHVQSCRTALVRSAEFLQSTEHPVALIGSPGVGKTTAICALTPALRDTHKKDIDKQMVLQTGSGRITICEVHVRRGGEYAITIEPCSEDELRYDVSDFCDQLLNQAKKRAGDENIIGSGISAEMERMLRNMTALAIKKKKLPDGKYEREDPAVALLDDYPSKEELLIQIYARLNMSRRRRTAASYPRGYSGSAKDWLSKTFAEINFGHHLEFSIPKRIEVWIPRDVLGSCDLSVSLIDTRGIDEPSAPRRDLQTYLDDPRTVIVLCSGFEDAPSATVQAVIERATEGGLRRAIVNRGLLLILPREDQEEKVLSELSGEPVGDAHEGREIRLEQVQGTTLADLGVSNLPVEFLNVQRQEDCERVRLAVRSKIDRIRQSVMDQVDSLIRTVRQLIENKEDEQVRAVFDQATRPLLTWLANNGTLAGSMSRVDGGLLEDMDGLRYASSLRASVNRLGNWHRFDYWASLGDGTRRIVVGRSTVQITKLRGILETQLNDEQLSDAHDFLRHFEFQVDEAEAAFYVGVSQLGETGCSSLLRADHSYWQQCQDRWGGGSGYKSDIRGWTDAWFSSSTREAMQQFIADEVDRRWADMIDALAQHMEPSTVSAPTAG